MAPDCHMDRILKIAWSRHRCKRPKSNNSKHAAYGSDSAYGSHSALEKSTDFGQKHI